LVKRQAARRSYDQFASFTAEVAVDERVKSIYTPARILGQRTLVGAGSNRLVPSVSAQRLLQTGLVGLGQPRRTVSWPIPRRFGQIRFIELSRKGFRPMNAKSGVSVWLVLIMASVAAGLLIDGGCALDKNGSHPGNVYARVGGHSGQIVEPKRCLLKVAILSRPFGDRTINEVVWKVADEQIIPPAERRAWEANGLRIGRIIGEVPLELEAILKDTSPQKKVNPANIFVDSGEPTLIVISEPVELASLLLNRENRIFGNDYRDASGFFRVTPQHAGPNSVSLRLVPEIHHGPIQRTFQAVPNATPLGPQEFRINNGQQEETIRELATTLVLEPGQMAVIGCRPTQKRSLGAFMLTQSVAHSDQRVEKLILIWATRNLSGQVDDAAESNTSDRPNLFKRLIGPSATPIVPKSAPSTPEIPALEIPLPTSSAASTAAGSTTSPNGPSVQIKPNTPVPADPQTTSKSAQMP
jgi:hypothetical protein